MRQHHPHGYSFWVFLSDVAVFLLLGWLVFTAGHWFGWTYAPSCYLGWSLAALLRSTFLDGIAMLCVLAWMLTLGRKVAALIWAVGLTVVVGWATAKVPELLANC